MLTVLYFQRNQKSSSLQVLDLLVVYTVRFPLRENQENCVTKRSAFLFALMSTSM